MNIAEILCRHAATRPDAPAILDVHRGRSRALSFAELDLASSRAAALLQNEGVAAGDGVLIFHAMSAELYAALIGAFRLGAVPMFLDPSAGREHIERCCHLWPPKAMIASTKAHLLRFVSPALRRIPRKFAIGGAVPGAVSWNRTSSLTPLREILASAPDAPALITFTSGSTGLPKAAVRNHAFLLEQHRVLAESLRLAAGDLDLTTLPIFVLANLGSGVTSLIPDADLRSPGKIDPAPVIGQIRSQKPGRTAAPPAFLERLGDYCAERKLFLPELKKIFVGGAPVFPNLLRKLHGISPDAEVTAVYGSTEAEPIAEILFSQIEPSDFGSMVQGRGLLAGRPVPQIRLAILEEKWGKPIGTLSPSEFQSRCMPAGEAGEIVVSGGHVLSGYLGGKGDSETKFDVDGMRWHRTGDAGYLDERGRVWLLGRCDARIEDEHGVLHPFAAECAAQQVPGVRRAALIAHNGRRLLAVELDKGSGAGIVAAVQNAVRWARIDSVRVLPKIPVDKRHNSKVNYPELRKLIRR
ncbi:MAG: AMP-binding protein [Candidatus Acidiferrales bacterium]